MNMKEERVRISGIRKAEQKDLEELLAIYNYEVLNGVATFDLEPKSYEERQEWMDQHNVGHHPLYVAVVDGKVAGYVSLSPYREKEAYHSTVELSVYVGVEYRGMGIATALMDFIIDYAKNNEEIHTIVSVITSGNKASKKLHERYHFEFCGTIKEVGIKFNQYRDIDNYRLGVAL